MHLHLISLIRLVGFVVSTLDLRPASFRGGAVDAAVLSQPIGGTVIGEANLNVAPGLGHITYLLQGIQPHILPWAPESLAASLGRLFIQLEP